MAYWGKELAQNWRLQVWVLAVPRQTRIPLLAHQGVEAHTYSPELRFVAYSVMDSWIFFLVYKAEFDLILPFIHHFYMSYSQWDLVRSPHFTAQKNSKSSHTLGDLIGACVYGGSLTHVRWPSIQKSWCFFSPLAFIVGKEEGTPWHGTYLLSSYKPGK